MGLAVLGLVSCAPSPGPADLPQTQLTATATLAVDAFVSSLGAVEYPLDLAPGGSIALDDGEFSGPAAPGSATRLTVRLGDQVAMGDLNGDGVDDAAVVLIADPGGSGTFYYVAAVINSAGIAKGVDSVLLGDRITIESLAIDAGQIKVVFLDRSPSDPMSSAPSVRRSESFRLSLDRLEPVR
jgi:hypothetical protein